MTRPLDDPRFVRLLQSAREIQGRLLFLPSVLVGGTAAALYAGHRVFLDADFVSPLVKEKFDEIERALGEMTSFEIARLRRPVLILGRLRGDEIGVRQLRRRESIEAVQVEGLWVPTLAEMIRIKAFLLSDRRATRDYVDVCALVRTAGREAALRAMERFDALYDGLCAAGALTAFAEAAHDDPADREFTDLSTWRNLDAAYADLARVHVEVREFALRAIQRASARRDAGAG